MTVPLNRPRIECVPDALRRSGSLRPPRPPRPHSSRGIPLSGGVVMADGQEPTPAAAFTVAIPEDTTVLEVMSAVIEMLSQRYGVVVVDAEVDNTKDGELILELRP